MKNKTLFLVLTVLIALNLVYYGVQAVDKATAVVQADGFDDLELIDEPLTPTQLLIIEEGYRQRMELIEEAPNEIRLELDRAIKGYPAQIVSVDYNKMYVIVNIWGWMVGGSDSECEASSEMFHAITTLGFTLEVTGSFVPSRENPMTVKWTRHLISLL